jgi:hypothetical protein
VADVDRDLADAGQRRELVADELFQALVLALRGIGELHVDDDVRTLDLDLAHRLRGDEIAPGIGIGQRVQAGLDVGLGNGHRRDLFDEGIRTR